jgi:hypothetical protein
MGALSSESSEPNHSHVTPLVSVTTSSTSISVFLLQTTETKKDTSMYNCVVRTSKHLFGLRHTDSHNTNVSVRLQISVPITMSLARDIQNPLQTIARINPIGRMVRLFLISNLALFLLSNCVEGFQFHSQRVLQNAFSELSDQRVSRSHRVQHMTKDNDDVDMKTLVMLAG